MSGVISNHPGESVRTITYLEFGLLVVTLASTLFYVTLQSILFLYRYLYFIFAFTLMKFLWGEYTSELRGGTRKCSNTVSMDGKTVVITGESILLRYLGLLIAMSPSPSYPSSLRTPLPYDCFVLPAKVVSAVT